MNSLIAKVLSQGSETFGPGAMLSAAGGLAGGAASIISGGGFLQGAMAGTIGTAGLYYGGGSVAKAFINDTQASFLKKDIISQDTSNAIIGYLDTTKTAEGRRVALMAGGGLAGFMFGGKKDYRSGFNKNRGSKF